VHPHTINYDVSHWWLTTWLVSTWVVRSWKCVYWAIIHCNLYSVSIYPVYYIVTLMLRCLCVMSCSIHLWDLIFFTSSQLESRRCHGPEYCLVRWEVQIAKKGWNWVVWWA
jgi:hypothetical protein